MNLTDRETYSSILRLFSFRLESIRLALVDVAGTLKRMDESPKPESLCAEDLSLALEVATQLQSITIELTRLEKQLTETKQAPSEEVH